MNERLEQLRHAISEHPGASAHGRWARLGRTHAILTGNLRDLAKLIDAPARDPGVALELVSNTGAHDTVQDAFLDEFDRLLHNLVAAIGTLIDHTRIVARCYEHTPFHDEYVRRVAEVGALPVARFVKDLRNYMLHQGLPAPFNNVTLSPHQVRYELQISVPALLQSSSWSAASREYLATHGERLPIRRPFEEYASAIDGLYEWMFAQPAALDAADIEAANALIDEYNDVLTGRRE